MKDILRFARQCGKRILLTSDMYLEASFIEKQLKRCGVVDYDELLISCEIKHDKYKETIWDYVKELFPAQSVLHIGDNVLVDVEKPLRHGIDTWKVAKAAEMLEWSGIYGYWNKEDIGMLGGLFAAQAMNDPFVLSDSRGKLVIKNMYEMGYLFFGPLVLGFLCWLVKTARAQRIDTLLFAARDGYLLEKLYDKLSETIEGKVPKGVYFLTSRRAASVAMIRSEEDIRFVIENVCNVAGVNLEELLRFTFGVQIKKAEEWRYKTVRELGKEKVIQYVLQHYQKCILERAEQERQAYLAYIKSLPLSGKKGFVNFVCRGVSQYCMERLSHEPMTGLYFAGEELGDIFPDCNRIYAWYGTACSTHTSKEDLLAGYLFGEVIFSAPQGQLICFDRKGEAIFEDRECDFTGIAECHEGIEKYVEDVIQRVPDFLNYEWDRELIDRIFGSFRLPYVILEDAVKKNFVFQDGIAGKGMTLL
ncbi:MAG: hypothetical protein NC331_09770 [Lachnospiraceae bacterium]|nr:hypothetical protein [Lachnospiraceae bacterium]